MNTNFIGSWSSFRILTKKPIFSAIAIITLALGIGANTAIFSVVQAVILRPLPFPEQERLIVAWKQDTTRSALNAVGKRLRLGDADSDPWTQIVGVAGDVRYRALQDERLDLYILYAQWQSGVLNHLAIRSTLAPAQALALVQRELKLIDPMLAVSLVMTMDDLVAAQLSRPRFNAVLLNWLSALALLLAATGIYGVMTYTVAERTTELGLRIALGAQSRDILILAIGQGMTLVVTGIALGLFASFALTRLLTTLLFAVSPTDPLMFAALALLLALVALVACWIPARRATKVDPLVALRLP